jgi:ubiquinone/menaquinone biosynthesis C-methylase UbiE
MVGQAGRFAAKCEFYVNLMVADALFLPFPDNTFDWAISVATYHHIKGEEERERAFRELRRVLKPQGEAFLTVWNHGQTRFWFTPKEQQIPWKLKEKTVYRYYYLFSYGELRRILIKTGWKIVALSAEESHRFPIKNFSRNICVLVRKD